MAGFKAEGEEVEITAMDVQADVAGIRPEHATIVFDSTGMATQAHATIGTSYDDTDQLPAVPRQRRKIDKGTLLLRIAVVLLAAIVLAAGVALGLIKSGIIHKTTPGAPPAKAAVTPTTATPIAANTPLLTQTATTPDSTSYSIPSALYVVTVTAGPSRSWVSISAVGHQPAFEGIVNAGTSQREILLGPSTIEVGAGGTTVTVAAGKHTQALKSPTAPYSFQISPTS